MTRSWTQALRQITGVIMATTLAVTLTACGDSDKGTAKETTRAHNEATPETGSALASTIRAAALAPATGAPGQLVLVQEHEGLSVGSSIDAVPASYGVPQTGEVPAAAGDYQLWQYGHALVITDAAGVVQFILPGFNFAEMTPQTVDSYFGQPTNVAENSGIASRFYATNDPNVFFLVQWLPVQDRSQLFVVSGPEDFVEGQTATVLGGAAIGFGTAGSYDTSVTESEMPSWGMESGTCQAYMLDNPTQAVFADGQLLGFSIDGTTNFTGRGGSARGVQLGDSADSVRAAYADAQIEQLSSPLGDVLLLHSPYQGEFFTGVSLDDHGAVTGIRTGTKGYASFQDLCANAAPAGGAAPSVAPAAPAN